MRYTEMLQNDKTPEADGRLENIKKLISDIDTRSSIYQFLEEISLVIDNSVDNDNSLKVSLMTLHSAKGLEFKVVFLPGWEEGIFPNQRSIEEKGNKGLEEERRLAYVGITRAREDLYILYSNARKQFNQSLYRTIPSRFLTELPKNNCEVKVIKDSTYLSKMNLKSNRYEKEGFIIGDKVSHSEFGNGIILGVDNDKLQIRFDKQKGVIKIFSDFIKKI
jgi:DNA helicase-2/ATP-dependent DNA helicase PcrA